MAESDCKRGPSTPAARAGGTDILLVGLLCLATAVVFGKSITLDGLRDVDSAAHAMDGVLIHDWVAAGPAVWLDPIEFAERQYGHYPTLGIGRHYPPGFAIVEAAFFGVLGISAVTARLCVLLFGVAAAVGTYVFVRPLAGRIAATFAALILITMPAATVWGRQVMLEVPTVAVLVWGAVALSWYLRSPTGYRLGVLTVVALSAVVFKQTGVFLVCAIGATLFLRAIFGRARLSHGAIAVAVAVGTLALVVLSFDEACAKTLSGYDVFADRWGFGALTFYLATLPEQTGTIVLILAGFGLLLSRRLPAAEAIFLVSWLAISYVMVMSASLKTPRFFFVGLFPLAVWGGLCMSRVLTLLPAGRLRPIVSATVALLFCAVGLAHPVGHAPDYGTVVAANRDKLQDQVVLFSGLRDGDFAFAARQHLDWHGTTVIRGSKLFYTCTAGPDLDLVSYVLEPDDLIKRMRSFAFAYVFVERENHVGTAEDDWLRDYLSTGDDYRLVETYPFQAVVHDRPARITIDVYELAAPLTRTVDYFDIPMPRTGSPIRVDLTRSVALATDE